MRHALHYEGTHHTLFIKHLETPHLIMTCSFPCAFGLGVWKCRCCSRIAWMACWMSASRLFAKNCISLCDKQIKTDNLFNKFSAVTHSSFSLHRTWAEGHKRLEQKHKLLQTEQSKLQNNHNHQPTLHCLLQLDLSPNRRWVVTLQTNPNPPLLLQREGGLPRTRRGL